MTTHFHDSDLEWISSQRLSSLSYGGREKLKGEEAKCFKRLKESKIIGSARDLVYFTKKGRKIVNDFIDNQKRITGGIHFKERDRETGKDDWRKLGPWTWIKMKKSGHHYMRCKGLLIKKKPWSSFKAIDETKSFYNQVRKMFSTFKSIGASVKLKPRIYQYVSDKGVYVVWMSDKSFRYRHPIKEEYFDMIHKLHPNAKFYTGKGLVRAIVKERANGRYYIVAFIKPYDMEKYPKPDFEAFKNE